jgi:hypothetical protein
MWKHKSNIPFDNITQKKIVFLYGAKENQEGKVRNLFNQDVEKMVKSFKDYACIKGYCHIAIMMS